MIIHNFFSDVAQSIFNFFEKFVFPTKPYFYHKVVVNPQQPRTFFKSMQFNLGNQIYQIGDYKESAKLEFPNAQLTYVSNDSAFGKDFPLIAHHTLRHVNEIVATHNDTTNVDIVVREDQTLLYFTFQINCESQLQANEIEHQVKRYLPIQKYIQMYSFKSFQEIPEFFFFKHNDPEKHVIHNLFFRRDDTTGNPQYYFLANYKPIFKLNSINADFSDNSQRSYTVLLDFEYLIQMPIWMASTYNTENIARIEIGFTLDDHPRSIILNDEQLSSTDYDPKKINDIYYQIVKSVIVNHDDASNKENKIVIEKPDIVQDDKFALEIIKVKNPISDFVEISNSAVNKIHDNSSKILTDNDYTVVKTEDGKNDQIVIFIDKDYKPENNLPVIIRIYIPMTNQRYNNELKKINMFNKDKIYVVRDQKCWHR